MKKSAIIASAFLLILLAFLVYAGTNASPAIRIISPSSDTNNSGNILFNVTYLNGTDITSPINATFFFNETGLADTGGNYTSWTEIFNSTGGVAVNVSCRGDGYCFGTVPVNLSDGVYAINATLSNGTDLVDVSEAANLSQRVIIDNTPPIVLNNNISSPVSESNNSGSFIFNVSIVDALAGVGAVTINITNSSGEQNTTITATKEGSTSQYSVSINTTHFPDGTYNLTVFANDTTNGGNLNNSAFVHTIDFDNTAPSITHSCSPTSVNTGETITCTCTATDSPSGVTLISFTTNPSTSSAGSFTTTCTSNDFAGNSGSSDVSYTVTESGGGGSPGGGSSSGSGSSSSPSQSPPSSEDEEGSSPETTTGTSGIGAEEGSGIGAGAGLFAGTSGIVITIVILVVVIGVIIYFVKAKKLRLNKN